MEGKLTVDTRGSFFTCPFAPGRAIRVVVAATVFLEAVGKPWRPSNAQG
jgi:hypothetical protein